MDICNKTTGHCVSGCLPGKQEDDCQADCTDLSFGRNCSNSCQCFTPGEVCSKETGHCKSGCTAGKHGDGCQRDCTNGRFGPNCNLTCHCNRSDEACDKKTGHCMSGCAPGKQGDDCQTDCKNGSFGFNCTKQCQCVDHLEVCKKKTGHCDSGCAAGKQGDDCHTDCKGGMFGSDCALYCQCKNESEVCNKTNGHCESGCTSGKQGEDCQQVIQNQEAPPTSNAGMVAGIIVTVLVLIFVAVAAFIIWRKRFRKSPDGRHNANTERSFNDISETEHSRHRKSKETETLDKRTSSLKKGTSRNKVPEAKSQQNMAPDNVYENTDTYYNILPSPIPLATLRQYIKDKLSGVGFENEYKLLRSGLIGTHEEGKRSENKRKTDF